MKTKVYNSLLYLVARSLFLVSAVVGPAAAEPVIVVVPNGLENTEGNGSMGDPGAQVALDGCRQQDLLSESQFSALPGPMWLIQIAWRPNQHVVDPRTVTWTGYDLRLSTTDQSPDNMSTTFSDNTGPDETVVFEGDWAMSTDASGPPDGPRNFDYILDLQTPFLYDRVLGNLLLDHSISQMSRSPAWDKHDPFIDGLFHRVWGYEPFSDDGVDFRPVAYVHQFTFVPYGDFDRDGVLAISDLDLLSEKIAGGPPYDLTFDLSDDGAVDHTDLDQWLFDAAHHNGFSEAYLDGDSNLDGSVDAADLNNLALSWQEEVALWSAGDFNADGSIDAADLNRLALNWQQSVALGSPENAPVPEPSTYWLIVVGLLLAWSGRRHRSPRQSFSFFGASGSS